MNGKSNRNQPVSRSFSLPGLLALLTGCGQLFGTWKFHERTQAWPELLRYGNIAIAFCLTLWGVRQIVADWQKGRASGTPRRNKLYRVSLPVEGIVFLVIMSVMFIGSMLGRSNMLLLVFSLLAGAFIANGFISFNSLRKLQVNRQIPNMIAAGEPTNVYLEVLNQKRMAVWVLTVTDELSNSRETLHASIVFTRIGSRGKQIGQYRIQLMQRGRYRLGPVQFTTRFPLGIVERSALLTETEELIVCPRPGRLLVKRSPRNHVDQLVMRTSSRVGAYDDEFHRIREYRHGDNYKAIHWRTSARRNELMVREYHENRDENLLVLLDLWQPSSPHTTDLESVETAVSFAATLVKDHLSQVRDSEICIACAGDQFTDWTGQAGLGSWQSALKYLALVTAGPTTSLEPIRDFWKTRRSPDTRLILITTRNLGEISTLLNHLSNDPTSPGLNGFENDVLIYSAIPGALDHVFEPPENLVHYEKVPEANEQRPGASPVARTEDSFLNTEGT